jgi:hypothetical protein
MAHAILITVSRNYVPLRPFTAASVLFISRSITHLQCAYICCPETLSTTFAKLLFVILGRWRRSTNPYIITGLSGRFVKHIGLKRSSWWQAAQSIASASTSAKRKQFNSIVMARFWYRACTIQTKGSTYFIAKNQIEQSPRWIGTNPTAVSMDWQATIDRTPSNGVKQAAHSGKFDGSWSVCFYKVEKGFNCTENAMNAVELTFETTAQSSEQIETAISW